MVEPPVAPVPQLTPGRLLWRGFLKRCPVCSQGHLFRRWFSMVDACPRCGLRFEREQGGFIGAIGMNTIVSFLVLLVVLIVSFVSTYPDPPVATILPLMIAVAVILPLAFYPSSKTLWVAIDIAMRPLEPGEVKVPWGQPS